MLAFLFQYDDSPSVFPAVGVAALAGGLFLLYARRNRGRAEAMRKLADRRGLTAIYTTLPRDFPRRLVDEQYAGWLIPRWSNPHNIIGGQVGQDFLLAFDINVLKGEKTYRRTIVARSSATPTEKSGIGKGYVYRARGDWQMATLESSQFVIGRLIEPGTIERLWESLR